MWRLAEIDTSCKLWFSDGNPVDDIRGGDGVSSRLIVADQGFLDLTELHLIGNIFLDVNGFWILDWPGRVVEPEISSTGPSAVNFPLEVSLKLPGDGTFTASLVTSPSVKAPVSGGASIPTIKTISGTLKPLPQVSDEDVAYIDQMIAQKFVPYQDIPAGKGKSPEQIAELGKRLFPFSPHSFQLAMSIYDYTTASFVRLVFLKVFQYTNMKTTPLPLDLPSIAQQIWESNWGKYTPKDPFYMKAFMMKPATSLENVKTQLSSVATELQKFSDVQNRLAAAAMQSVPRTSVRAKAQLYSGQVDIYQMGLGRFGVEFLECPLNEGPHTQPLSIELDTAMATYVSPGHIITTKMIWSFTDTMDDAMHYSNGILLVANRPEGSWVWDTASYVTPVSDSEAKAEYTFMPGSRFEVNSAEQTEVKVGGKIKPVLLITLTPLPFAKDVLVTSRGADAPVEAKEALPKVLSGPEVAKLAAAYKPTLEQSVQFINADAIQEDVSALGAIELPQSHPSATHYTLGHETNGRRCTCFDVVDNLFA